MKETGTKNNIVNYICPLLGFLLNIKEGTEKGISEEHDYEKHKYSKLIKINEELQKYEISEEYRKFIPSAILEDDEKEMLNELKHLIKELKDILVKNDGASSLIKTIRFYSEIFFDKNFPSSSKLEIIVNITNCLFSFVHALKKDENKNNVNFYFYEVINELNKFEIKTDHLMLGGSKKFADQFIFPEEGINSGSVILFLNFVSKIFSLVQSDEGENFNCNANEIQLFDNIYEISKFSPKETKRNESRMKFIFVKFVNDNQIFNSKIKFKSDRFNLWTAFFKLSENFQQINLQGDLRNSSLLFFKNLLYSPYCAKIDPEEKLKNFKFNDKILIIQNRSEFRGVDTLKVRVRGNFNFELNNGKKRVETLELFFGFKFSDTISEIFKKISKKVKKIVKIEENEDQFVVVKNVYFIGCKDLNLLLDNNNSQTLFDFMKERGIDIDNDHLYNCKITTNDIKKRKQYVDIKGSDSESEEEQEGRLIPLSTFLKKNKKLKKDMKIPRVKKKVVLEPFMEHYGTDITIRDFEYNIEDLCSLIQSKIRVEDDESEDDESEEEVAISRDVCLVQIENGENEEIPIPFKILLETKDKSFQHWAYLVASVTMERGDLVTTTYKYESKLMEKEDFEESEESKIIEVIFENEARLESVHGIIENTKDFREKEGVILTKYFKGGSGRREIVYDSEGVLKGKFLFLSYNHFEK